MQGVTVYIYSGHYMLVNTVTWSPNGQRIASAGEDRTVQVWDPLNGNDAFTYHNHSDVVTDVTWSPDGQWIASASDDQTVQVGDATFEPRWLRALALRAGYTHSNYEGHANAVQAMARSPGGRHMPSGGND